MEKVSAVCQQPLVCRILEVFHADDTLVLFVTFFWGELFDLHPHGLENQLRHQKFVLLPELRMVKNLDDDYQVQHSSYHQILLDYPLFAWYKRMWGLEGHQERHVNYMAERVDKSKPKGEVELA